MLSGITARYGLRPDQIAIVGDRIYTDIQMARNADAFGVLVLSGETTKEKLDGCGTRPDLTMPDVGCLGHLLERCKPE